MINYLKKNNIQNIMDQSIHISNREALKDKIHAL
jgi:hypothetical protein